MLTKVHTHPSLIPGLTYRRVIEHGISKDKRDRQGTGRVLTNKHTKKKPRRAARRQRADHPIKRHKPCPRPRT